MEKSIGNNSKFHHFFISLSKRLDSVWAKYLLLPLLITSPPGSIGLYITYHYTDPSQLSGVNAHLPNWLVSFLQTEPLFAQILSFLYIAVLTALFSLIKNKADSNLINIPGLLALFNTFEQVVGTKAKRFGNFLRNNHDNDDLSATTAFNDITQPEQQIAKLAEALHAFLDTIDETGASFRIGIAEIEKNAPSEWLYFSPESQPPKTPIEDLQAPNSAISTCIRRKKLVIVEDILKESQKENGNYIITREDAHNEEGSQICYPVLHYYTETVPYVITIAANRKNYFTETKKELYEWVLRHFSLRFELEHSLLLIKEGAK